MHDMYTPESLMTAYFDTIDEMTVVDGAAISTLQGLIFRPATTRLTCEAKLTSTSPAWESKGIKNLDSGQCAVIVI